MGVHIVSGEEMGAWTGFGQKRVAIVLVFFHLDPRMDKIGQMEKIQGLPLEMSLYVHLIMATKRNKAYHIH